MVEHAFPYTVKPTVGANPWNDPASPYFMENCNVAIQLDALHTLIPFDIARCDVGATFDDLAYWFRRAESAGLITGGEYMELVRRMDCAAYRRTCRR